MSAVASSVKTNKMAKKVAAPAPAAPAAAAPAAAAPAKKTASKAKAEVTVPTVTTPAPAAAASAPAEVRSAETILTSLQETLRSIQTEVASRTRSAIAEATAAVKALKREARDSKKKRRVDPATLSPEERAKYDAKRANNAFLRQRGISDELAAFIGIAAGSKRSQTEVSKFISDYIKSHNC
jgi:chromatin remodeling complex protein RSC6